MSLPSQGVLLFLTNQIAKSSCKNVLLIVPDKVESYLHTKVNIEPSIRRKNSIIPPNQLHYVIPSKILCCVSEL